MAGGRSAAIYLFRNDLRLHDNECWNLANRLADYVIPVYCFDPTHFQPTWHFKFNKTERHRAKFLVESVQNLKKNLQTKSSDLFVFKDVPHRALKDIMSSCASGQVPVNAVIYQKEVTYEEINVEAKIKDLCEANKIKVHEIWGSTLYNLQDLPFKVSQVPDTYTNFRKDVESRARVRPVTQEPAQVKPLPKDVILNSHEIPSLTDLGLKDLPAQDRRTAFPFQGGETTGLHRLNEYLWGTNAVATYKETRNGLLGTNYSTKFSPWLAHGCISPRFIFREIKRYEKEVVSNNSTYWVIFELLWRDYFRFVCLKYGDSVFYRTGIKGREVEDWSKDLAKFRLWAEGRTGVPFVDANMRELKETGWMSNRGRQNVASYLIKDMGMDWRLGAEWFESYLLDHDVCSNYGNWNYAAGIGNDPRENRKFNMIKQGMDYDPNGDYVRTWVTELANIPGGKIHVPWTLSSGELERYGVSLGENYPKPVVVAPEWSKHSQGTNNKQNYRGGKGGGQQRGGGGSGGQHRGGGTGGQQRGIDFYFKSEKSGGQGGEGRGSGGPRGGGGRGGARGIPRGGRVQY